MDHPTVFARRLRGMGVSAISYRALARQLGVTDRAVRKAAKPGGRLASFVGVQDGHPVITDAEAATRVWHETSRRPSTAQAAGVAIDPASPRPRDGSPTGTRVISAETLTGAQRLATIERARKLQLENDVTEGRLVDVEKAAKEAFEAARVIREALLNLPARLAGPLAAEPDPTRVHIALDAAIREALATSADALVAMTG